MKKTLALVLVMVFVLVLTESVMAQSRTIVINPGPLYIVRVNGSIRELRTFQENGNLHLRFFNGQELLGEEIFDKDDVKVYDAYIENNGDWKDGYQKRYR